MNTTQCSGESNVHGLWPRATTRREAARRASELQLL